MGWDIDVVCEYKHPLTGEWIIADDYIEHHSATNSNVIYQIVNPLAEFRNYNLFRPLANIHNTQRCIDNERVYWEEYATTHRSCGYVPREIRNLEVETTTPTNVVQSQSGFPQDASWVTQQLEWANQDNDQYQTTIVINLATLAKFCQINFQYHQLISFKEKAMTKYNNIRNFLSTRDDHCPELEMQNFRIICHFYC